MGKGKRMTEEIKRMDIKEFRNLGFLQEINRKFLHPLGLAMEVIIDEDGSERLGGIWDYRHDPEGMFFVQGSIKQDRAEAIEELRQSKVAVRRDNPYGVPVDDEGIQTQ